MLSIVALLSLVVSCGDGFKEEKSRGSNRGQASPETDAYTVNIKYLDNFLSFFILYFNIIK
jgi:hypothetical protein